jgi:hypothetical protein
MPGCIGLNLESARVGKCVVAAVREGGITHAEGVVLAKDLALGIRRISHLPARELPSWCAPSIPIKLATLPLAIAFSASAAVRQNAKVSLYLSIRLRETSICSRVSEL